MRDVAKRTLPHRPSRIGETRFDHGRLSLPKRERERPDAWVKTVAWTLFGAASLGSAASLLFGWYHGEPQYMSSDNPWSLTHSAEQRAREETQAMEGSAYFSSCDEARAAGAAPVRAGQPGYREGMDSDGDGVACEPDHGN